MNLKNDIYNLQQINEIINTGEPVLIYFSSKNCSVCKVLKPKIEKVILDNFPKFKMFEIKSDLYKEITSQFTVFSVPTLILYFDKKEFKRYSRNISIGIFLEDIKRPYTLMYE